MPEIKKVKRMIHYYELMFDFSDDFDAPPDNDQCRHFFALIKKMATTRSKARYQAFGEKALFLQDVTIKPAEKLITGKMRCIRKDLLPEIMDTNTDEARGIETKEQEGLVETTHFIIDFSKQKKRLAIEYNQFGARIVDFVFYLEKIGEHKKATKRVGFVPLVKDELKGIKERINRCSQFVVKVHKDRIAEIESMDNDLYSALIAAEEHFDSEYVQLTIKFDYKKRTDTKKVGSIIKNLIDSIIKDKNAIDVFNTLEVKAEDSAKNNKLQVFDLLIDKIKDELLVERKPLYRIVVSNDILPKMQEKLQALR